jgi:hypothetical protein
MAATDDHDIYWRPSHNPVNETESLSIDGNPHLRSAATVANFRRATVRVVCVSETFLAAIRVAAHNLDAMSMIGAHMTHSKL